MSTLKFLGHSCFQLTHANTSLILDPFLTDNPTTTASSKDIACNYILVSHAHSDHLGDTVSIAKNTQATIISTFEVANHCSEHGCNTHAMHIGGKHSFDFGYVRITQAFHGAGVTGGHACGFVINFFGKTIYFAGDTGIFRDMSLIGQLEKIDYALLPIGDNFTMGPADAALAANMLKPKAVIPMHYNTWPLINQNPAEFKEKVESQYNIPVYILTPGQELTLDN